MSSWFDDPFMDEMDRMVRQLLSDETAQEETEQEQRREEEEPDEIIDGKKSITYILNAPGFEKDDFLVSLQDREIEVKTGEFMIKKKLPALVKPKTAVSSYRNGILSITVKKA